ncbi:Predicted metal-sulfur cluster biosynthetic enzyme [Methylacidimicrobium sp. AP8]|uniref:putative Fe-S cluster assembly protein SufT n=1 Tax=Methylacidimicrobium sp. AP8 TaxID=2730359 RepID=UPI0018C04B26|nr:putative Fe-S cluster assembly protein SufT [Methylacidimicrobium sp. AP8]CAB4244702.1 Predicted metal-sulfur cluster biosynthetic enzyme [Methylacidimicrobium sp. AP8]
MAQDTVILTRSVDAVQIPSGAPIRLEKDRPVVITQSLGGAYTLLYDSRCLVRLDAKDADAIGQVPPATGSSSEPTPGAHVDEEMVYSQLRQVFDPEIPVNIVDLGLIYDCQVLPREEGTFAVVVKMTLTAPGCGMGVVIARDAESRIRQIPNVTEARVELVWDPPWNPSMISEQGKMQLGLV